MHGFNFIPTRADLLISVGELNDRRTDDITVISSLSTAADTGREHIARPAGRAL